LAKSGASLYFAYTAVDRNIDTKDDKTKRNDRKKLIALTPKTGGVDYLQN